MAGPADVPGPAVLARRLLRLAEQAAERPAGAARGPGRRDRGRPPRGEGPLRQPEDPRRVGGPRRDLLREHRGQADARPGVAARTKRNFRGTTDSNHDRPLAENILDRRFEPETADRAWAADITYIPAAEGWLYLAAVIDLYSRKVVGWAAADNMRSELPLEPLRMALAHRRPAGALLHHSDRGSQYARDAYRALLAGHGIEPSMSRAGSCWDNCGGRGLLQHAEARAGPPRALRRSRGGASVTVRVHRSLLYRSQVETRSFASCSGSSSNLGQSRSIKPWGSALISVMNA